MHPRSRIFIGFTRGERYYVYNCLPFGLSTAPWVFSMVMRELVMYWRRGGIRLLPYLDEFLLMAKGFGNVSGSPRKLKRTLSRLV